MTLDADDIYKICGLFSGADDLLELRKRKAFLLSLWDAKEALKAETVTPFQATVIKAAFGHVDVDSIRRELYPDADSPEAPAKMTVVEALPASQDATLSSGEPSVEERLTAIWDLAKQSLNQHHVSSSDAKNVLRHCQALALNIRKLTPQQTASLSHALSTVSFQDYSFVSALARHGCEVSSQLSSKEVSRLYFNLSKLNVHDSMVAIVNQLEAKIDNLTWKDLFVIFQAVEKQPHTSAVMGKLLPRLVTKVSAHFGESSQIHAASFHRALLNSMTKYSLNKHPVCALAVRDVLRFSGSISEKDLFSILSSIVELKIGALNPTRASPASAPLPAHATADVPRAIAELVALATKLVATMDCRSIPSLMDLASMLPADTTELMKEMLGRLSNEAGKLSPAEVVVVVEMLSTYPPARGHVAIASLAFAVSMRKEGYDGDAVDQLLVSFARLGHFTDDFFTLADFALTSRHGIKSFANLKIFLSCIDKPSMIHHQMKAVVTAAVQLLVPALNDEELSQVRKELFRLGAEDRSLQQRILNRQQSIKKDRRGGFGSKGYDPVDDLL